MRAMATAQAYLMRLLLLRARQGDIALGAEDVAVEVAIHCRPLEVTLR